LSKESEARPLGDWIRETAARLDASSETPRVDAEYLVAHCVGVERPQLLAMQRECVALPGLDELVLRRLKFEPIAYILGEWEFYGIPLFVGAPALVPRPETELLVDAVRAHLTTRGKLQAAILDLCTGTGCIPLAIARHAPESKVMATDINPETLTIAQRNIRRHGMQDRISLLQGDLFDAIPNAGAAFDVIVSNPPYVSEAEYETLAPDIRDYEDPKALIAGADGLALIRRIVAEASKWLCEGGFLALEIGDEQAASVQALMREAGIEHIEALQDLAGIHRVVTGVRPA